MYDVIIIGAGYGGMSTAALLGEYGKKILVLEGSALKGGRAASFKDSDGYTWEYGAHSHRLAHKGIANQVFKKLGEEIEFIPEARDSKLIFKGKVWERPRGPLEFLSTPMLSLKARFTLLLFLLKLKKAHPHDWYEKTLLQFYRTWFNNKEVEEFLSFFGMTVMCPDATKVSAGEVIDFLQRALAAGIGVGEPAGGSAQLFKKLKKHIDKRGEIRLEEKAVSIIVENGHVRGVVTNNGIYNANRVVFAARLPLLLDIIDNSLLSNKLVSYAKNLENSSGLSIDFITHGPASSIKGSILGVDIPIWAKFQSNTDASFTPKDKYLSTWGIMLPWKYDGDPAVAEKTEKKLKSTISHFFPGFLPNIVKERKIVANVMNGNVLTPGQSKPKRPRVVCDTVQGLYFVGDTVRGDGCSGDISFSSAIKVADTISGEQFY
ncbi:MAG TPA: NAD(P)/FAD-dependent oxidoreductase [Desulfomonilia bacterium]